MREQAREREWERGRRGSERERGKETVTAAQKDVRILFSVSSHSRISVGVVKFRNIGQNLENRFAIPFKGLFPPKNLTSLKSCLTIL